MLCQDNTYNEVLDDCTSKPCSKAWQRSCTPAKPKPSPSFRARLSCH